MIAGETLKRYFLDELRSLRQESVRFARDFPVVATQLGLAGSRAKDPHVELLLQSFAFLTGQLRYALDLQDATLAGQLAEALQPELAAPLASMGMVQLQVHPTDANFQRPQRLAARSELQSVAKTGGVRCRFTTLEEVPFYPLEVTQVAPMAVNEAPAELVPKAAVSGLRVVVRALGHPMHKLALPQLRFALCGDAAYRLFDCLQRRVVGIAAGDADAGVTAMRPLPLAALRLGECAEVAEVAAYTGAAHPGLALLRRYFAFPEQQLTASLHGLPTRGCRQGIVLWLWLSEPCPAVDLESLRLNCVPAENLYRQRLEPFALQQGKVEYPLVGDRLQHHACEVHSVLSLGLTDARGAERPLRPAYGFSPEPVESDPREVAYFSLRRAPSQYPSVAGTESWVTFVDADHVPALAPGMRVGGSLWCTNRRWAEQLGVGDALQAAPGVPVVGGTFVSEVSAYHAPATLGEGLHRLCAQLGQACLPLQGGEVGLARLREVLQAHFAPNNARARQQVQGLRALAHRRVAERTGREAWHGLTTGIELTLTVEQAAFAETSALLLGRVLGECFGHFAPLNSFVRLSLRDVGGETLWRFPARSAGRWEP